MKRGQSLTFRKHFPEFVCQHDRIQAELPGGLTAIARVRYDHDQTSPDKHMDGFWPSLDPKDAGYIGRKSPRVLARQMAKAKEIMRAWEANEWYYVGVCVIIEKDGVQLTGEYDHALWGVESNYPLPSRYRRNSYLRDVANELLPDALKAAQNKLQQLCCKEAA